MADERDLLLPEGARLLHIGPYKTGSTAIQATMFAAKDQLADYGVAYPGSFRRVVRPGYAVLNWSPRAKSTPTMDEWYAFTKEVADAGDKRVCISTEDFGSIRRVAKVREIVDDLGGERVHVLAVARNFAKLLPSQWQERVKSYDERSYELWLRAVLFGPEDDHAHSRFWASHDIEKMASRWLPVVGPDRFTLIVSDDSDRALLPNTFERMLGLPDGLLQLSQTSNASLTMNGTEVLRRVNELFSENGWPDEVYRHTMQRGLVPGLRDAPVSEVDERIPPLPRWAAERAAELSEKRIEAIKSLGIRVVGDPDRLRVDVPADAADTVAVPGTISVDAMVFGLEGVVRGILELEKRRRRELRAELRRTVPDAGPEAGAPGGDTRDAAGSRSVEETSGRELLRIVGGRAARRLKRR